MSKSIDAKDKSLRQVMSGVQYSIDFYQREYKWQTKQVEELVSDLTSRFLDSYRESHVRSEVATYPTYFLGSIVLSRRAEGTFIVDGQQRLTSLTLLLIYLRNLQISSGLAEDPNVQQLIQSTQYGTKSFNMSIPERKDVIECLYNGEVQIEEPEDLSSANIYDRYVDIEACFPEDCKGKVLPFFLDWLIERVQLVEISAYSDEDAYTVFETMNDRGLSLSPADMLKGYLLSNIRDGQQRNEAEKIWNEHAKALLRLPSKDSTNDFFRTWFRGRFASTYGGTREDYERLGPEFHRWFRDNSHSVGLTRSEDFFQFVSRELPVYASSYRRLRARQTLLEHSHESLYFIGETRIDDLLLLMAAVQSSDSQDLIDAKTRVMSRYLDIFVHRRVWASKNLQRPALKGTFIALARDVRNMSLEQLTARLYAELTKPGHDNFETAPPTLSGATRRKIHRLLARLTSYVEVEAGSGENPYAQLVVVSGRSRFDIEHIWPNQFDHYQEQFADQAEFRDYRNRLGSLLLIPHTLNMSYNDMPTSAKLPLYGRSDHHLLVASLAESAYQRNPRFLKWREENALPFRAYDTSCFSKASSDERLELYRSVARMIWDPELVLRESGLDPDALGGLIDRERDALIDSGSLGSRARTTYDVTLRDLLDVGILERGDVLIGRKEGLASTAIVLDDGSLELEDGRQFPAPSTAAMALGLEIVINGWEFWVHERSGSKLRDLRIDYRRRYLQGHSPLSSTLFDGQ
jgi:hypothetical protein